MMRTYVPMKLSQPEMDPGLRSDLESVNTWLRMLSTYMARVPVLPQGQPSALTPPAATTDDLADYFRLHGRHDGQRGAGSDATSRAVFQSRFNYNGLELLGYDFWDGSAGASESTNPARINLDCGAAGGTIDMYASAINFGERKTFPGIITSGVITNSLTSGSGVSSVYQFGLDATGYISLTAGDAFQAAQITLSNIGGDVTQPLLTLQGGVAQSGHLVSLLDNTFTEVAYMNGADWLTKGRMVIGDGSFNTERLLDLSNTNVSTNGTVTQINQVMTLKPTGASSGAYTGYIMQISDANTFSSGAYSVNGIQLTMTVLPPTGTTLNTAAGFNGSVTATNGGGGTVTTMAGGIWIAQGSTGAPTAVTNMYGLQIKVGQRTSAVTTARGISLENPGGSTAGAVTDFVGIDWATLFGNGVNVTTWHGLRHAAGPAAAIPNKWFFNLTSSASSLGNRILYKTAIGWTPATVSAVTAMLHLGAGTTALAPLMLTSGTSLTSALAGAIEFTTDDLFFTITTGAVRKRFLFADAVGGLTSGRVVYVTTGGRLTDITGFEFDGANLKVPGNIGAGGATATHFLNVPAGTTAIAPLKFTSGTDLTSVTDGCFEYDGTDLKFSIGASRLAVMYKNRAETITGTKTFTTDPVLANSNSLRGTDTGATVRTILSCLNTDVIRFAPLANAGGFTWTNIAGTVGMTLLPNTGVLFIGGTGTPSHRIDIAAGTTTIAPIRIASGTNLTAATAGCVEYDGSYVYLTHGDAVRTKAVTQRGAVDLTAQAAAIGATTIYTPPAAGYYVVHYTLEDTTSDITAGTIQFQVNYTDDIGATNQTGAALAMTAVGRDRGSFQVYSASGVISYQTNLTGIFGAARYALRVRVVALG